MSLNGLDDAAVKEAYEAAVAEPGGWYVMRNFSSYTGQIPHPPRMCNAMQSCAPVRGAICHDKIVQTTR